ncbi:MAG: hypothetical protein DRN30_05030 [Thermoplasmata archaeon]|nr:MAG: hypothetical protein DRN30_05030 [Thermoplasmata archaeon]
MAKKGKLPKLLSWWGGRIKEENPELSLSQAIAIATAKAQELGLLKKGTHELTKKGEQYSKKYYGKPLPMDLKQVSQKEKKKKKTKKKK